MKRALLRRRKACGYIADLARAFGVGACAITTGYAMSGRVRTVSQVPSVRPLVYGISPWYDFFR